MSALKPGCGRIEAVERRVDVAGVDDLAQDVGGRRFVIAVIDFRQHPCRRDAADLKMARVGEDRIGQPEVAVGDLLGAGGLAKSGTG